MFFFINPADSPSLFLHDLTIAYRKSREIVEIVSLAEKKRGTILFRLP